MLPASFVNPLWPAQFAPSNRASIFFPVPLTVLPLPCAACSLSKAVLSLLQRGATSEPRGPTHGSRHRACHSAGSQGVLILAGIHFELFSLCVPHHIPQVPLVWGVCLPQTSGLCSRTLVPPRLMDIRRTKWVCCSCLSIIYQPGCTPSSHCLHDRKFRVL